MSRHKLEYRNFVDSLDIDAFEEAINFSPFDHKRGEDIGHCPDLWGMHKHGDTTGKFAINRDKRVYHCWACGGGSLLSLAMSFLDADEESATEWIHQFAVGDIRTETQFTDDMFRLLDDYTDRKDDRMPYFNAHVLSQFHNEGEENELYEWCATRGISPEVAEEHQLGYSNWHKKLAPMRGGEKIDDDYFGPCVVFPHFWESKLVGWQHRWLNHGLDTPKWLPKYTNTSDFPRTQTIYNYEHAIKYPGNHGVIVVESVPTVLFLESLGLPAVATFGSGVKEAQLRMMRWFEGGVIIAPDNDAPGEKFAKAARDYLERFIDVTVLKPAPLGEGADLGDYIDVDDPVDRLYDHLENAIQDDVFD